MWKTFILSKADCNWQLPKRLAIMVVFVAAHCTVFAMLPSGNMTFSNLRKGDDSLTQMLWKISWNCKQRWIYCTKLVLVAKLMLLVAMNCDRNISTFVVLSGISLLTTSGSYSWLMRWGIDASFGILCSSANFHAGVTNGINNNWLLLFFSSDGLINVLVVLF